MARTDPRDASALANADKEEANTLARSLNSILSLFKLTTFSLDVTTTLADTIRAVCDTTDAQVGVLVLLDMDLLGQSPSMEPPDPQLRELLSDLAPSSDISPLGAIFHVRSLQYTGPSERTHSSAVAVVRSYLRDGSSLSVRIATEDADLGILCLAGKSDWAASPEASIINQLAPLVSLIVDNARVFTRTNRRERQAQALYETCREIISRLDLDYVLTAIVERAQQLVGADAAHLILQDRDSGELYIGVTRGIETPEYKYSRHKTLDGLFGKAVKERRAVISNDYLNDASIVHLADEVVSREGIRALICAPLFLQDRLFGAIEVCSRRVGYFNSEHARLINELASIAAVAVENARLYEEEREAVFRLRELNATIDSQFALQDKSMAIHDQLTRIAIGGKGADMIARALSRIVGNPVVVEDNLFNLTFYAPSVRQDGLEPGLVPDGDHQKPLQPLITEPGIRDQMAVLLQQRHPMKMPPFPQLDLKVPRIVAPIVVEDDIVGYVSVLELRRELEDLDYMSIEHGATALALEMAKRKAAADVERRQREDLMGELLCGGAAVDLDTIPQRAASLGFDLSKPHRVLVLRTGNLPELGSGAVDAEEGVAGIKTQIMEAVNKDVLRTFPHSFVADRSEGVAVILNLGAESGNSSTARVVELANRIREDVRRQRGEISVSIGIGNPCAQPREFSRSFEEATRALDMLNRLGDGNRVICFDDLGAYRVILRGDDRNEFLRFARDMLGKIIEHDQEFESALLDTLEAYLASSGHLKNTAQKLYVHMNTLRYRIEQIEDLTGLDLSDGETRLNLQLALKIIRAFSGQSSLGQQVPRTP